MTREKLVLLHNCLYIQYKNEMAIVFEDNQSDEFYSYLLSRKIVLPNYIRSNPTEWSLFAFLHEIGHIMTNTTSMKRYEQEYLATQWAIDKAKEIGFDVPEKYIDTYQKYIWKWRETSIKHKAKNVATKESLVLSA